MSSGTCLQETVLTFVVREVSSPTSTSGVEGFSIDRVWGLPAATSPFSVLEF